MTITFAPAKREKVKLRAALIGPPGSGKTLGALNIARALGEPVFGIDTEHDRMKLYADRFEFQHGNLPKGMQSPEGYIEAVRAAVGGGAGTVVIDSMSHEWLAILTEADRFSNWKDLTPRHNEFIETLVSIPAHLIVTMRAKVKYDVSEVQEGGKKKQKIERVGIGPVQRENVEYEFDILGYLDETHRATFLNRCDALVGQTLTIPEAIPLLLEWLESGEPDPDMQRAPEKLTEELRALLQAEGQADVVIDDAFTRTALKSGGVLTLGWVQEKIAAAHARASGAPPAAATPAADAAVPKSWAEIALLVGNEADQEVFEAFVAEAAQLLYQKPIEKIFSGSPEGNLTRAEWATLKLKAAGAVVNLLEATQGREFPPPSRAELQAAFATVLNDVILEGPVWSLGMDEPERPKHFVLDEDQSEPALTK